MAASLSSRRASGVEPPAAGEAVATHDLYERYASQVYGFCRHRLGSREEAEDAVQSTFLNAFRGLKRGVVPEAEAAWLFTIARNVCLSRRRSAWRRGRIEAPVDFELVQELTPAPAGRGDELMGLQEALAQMPESQRRAILLREWQGLSYREIAAELELSQGAVETLIFRARRSLAQGLETPPQSKRRRVRRGAFGDAVAALKSLLVAGSAASKVAATVAVVSGATVVASAPVEHHLAHIHRAMPAAPAPSSQPVAAKPVTATAPREAAVTSGSALGGDPPVAGAAGTERRTAALDGRAPAAGDPLPSHPQDEPRDSASRGEGQDVAAPPHGGDREASSGDGSAPVVWDQGAASSVASPPPDQASAGETSSVSVADLGAEASDAGSGDGGDG